METSLSVMAVFGAFLLHFPFAVGTVLGDAKTYGFSFGPNSNLFAVGDLSGINFQVPQSWAGQVPVPEMANDELFFWLFQAEKPSNDLIIWLNGGPGCSSLEGLMIENGPLSFPDNGSGPVANRHSWTKIANVLYIDQPVGAGFADGSMSPTMNAQVTQDFVSWLKSFYEFFPNLETMNTHIMGESWAGVYIPYFTQAILANKQGLPINLKSISLGDGTFGNFALTADVAATTYLKSKNHELHVPNDIIKVFDAADRQCGFDKVIDQLKGYPPALEVHIPGNPEGLDYRLGRRTEPKQPSPPTTAAQVNESINDPYWESCATGSTMQQYLMERYKPCFSVYNIRYNCTHHPNQDSFPAWLNQPAVRHALHAPNKTYTPCNSTLLEILGQETVVPPAYAILPTILERGIRVNIYSGDLDLLVNHVSTELTIQNMTWAGKQGFQRPPDRVWRDDRGRLAGNWGRERGLTYHRFLNAGHVLPHDVPEASFKYVRDFVVGDKGFSEKDG